MRQHLEGLVGRDIPQPDLDPPEFPEELRYLWDWCGELRMGLGEGMNGLALLSWATVDAWARAMGIEAEPREIQALFYLDSAFRATDPVKK